MHQPWIFAVCAAAAVVYAWPLLDPARAWDFIFIWDDDVNFVENAAYKGLTATHIRAMFTTVLINVWEPVGWLCKAIVYTFAGLSSRAFRMATLVLHLGATAALAKTSAYILAIMHTGDRITHLGTQTTEDLNPDFHLPGCILSALMAFAVHPIHVEVVAWPSAQPYALAGLFSALSLFFHCRRLHRALFASDLLSAPPPARGCSLEEELSPTSWDQLARLVSPSICDRDTLQSAACFVLAALSKCVCVLAPIATVLVDFLVIVPCGLAICGKSSGVPSPKQCAKLAARYLAGKILLLVAAGLFVSVTLAANRDGAGPHTDVITLTQCERLVKAVSTPAWIVQHVLWPADLRPHYELHDDEIDLWANPEYLLSTVSFVLVLALVSSNVTKKAHLPFLLALAYFYTMLLPTCGLIQHGMVSKSADRYAYFPMMAVVPVLGYWMTHWLRLNPRLDRSLKIRRTVEEPHSGEREGIPGRLAYLLVLAILLVISNSQMDAWQNSETLVEHSLRHDRTDSQILDKAFVFKDRWGSGCGSGFADCKTLLELSLHYSPVKSLKAKLYRYKTIFLLGRQAQACEGYKLLAAEYPDSALVENNLACCAFLEKRYLATSEHYRRAASLKFNNERERLKIEGNLRRLDEWSASVGSANGLPVGLDISLLW